MTVPVQARGDGADLNGVYDVIVLGAGPVGQNVAARTRAAGLSVAIVERELVGGECSYWGCIPSKSLLRPVIAIADARRIEGDREAIDGSIAPAGVFGRRDRYVTNWNDSGQADSVEAMDVRLVRGHARLTGPKQVAVATADQVVALTARHAVVICTGSTAACPISPVPPRPGRPPTRPTAARPRLVVVGAGGVGVEMATARRGWDRR
jgi:dihydrolipoamide dehydrogenase